MKKHVLYCKSEDGKFVFEKPFDIKNLPGKMEKYGRIKVTWEKYVPSKSLEQLGYYRGPMLEFITKERMLENGLTLDEWHEFFKGLFGKRSYDKTGTIENIKSHSEYNEEDMRLFIDKVIVWCAQELHLTIPPANSIGDYVD